MLFFLTDNKRKTIAHAIIIAFALQFILPLMPSNQLHADEGPATPEAAQFEPIDTSDLVNLFTGNFNYNVPLLEIPGPEGNWPINMSYHAGVNPNTEATWVGLGWTLNPGAINRFVNGYPDDYTGGIGKTHYYTKVEGHGYNFSASFGPVGIGISYDSYTGQSGVNMTLNLTSMLGNINQIVGTPLTGSTSLSIGTSGVGISGNIGMEIADGVGVSLNASVQSGQKPSFGGGISGSFANKGDKGALGGTLSYSNRGGFSAGANLAGASIGVNRNGVSASYTALSGTGVSFSSQSGGASFSVAGIGITSQAKSSGTGKTSSKSSGISIPQGLFGIPFGFSFGYYEWEWVLDETIYENSIGFMHQSKFDDSSTIAHSIGWPNYGHTYFVEDEVLDRANMYHIRGTNTALASTGYDYALDVKNMEKSVMEDHLFATEDVYQVNVQGLTGSFRPYANYAYELYEGSDGVGKLADVNSTKNTSSNIIFRFDGEQGGNFISMTTDADIDYTQISTYRQGSKQIQPVVDNANGILLGFKVLDADGKTYEFLRPVMNYFQYNYTRNYPDRNTTKSEVENETHSPYATTWYLTGIKGADYFDRGENGFSAEDWGFWVKFNYKRLAHPVGFRTPFSGDAKVPNKDGVAASIIRSYGAKEKVYLESIETASHIAFFDKSDRTDNLSPYVEYLAFEAFDVDGTDSSLEIKFPFDKADIASLLNSSAELVLEYMIKYEPYDHYPPPADGGWVTQTSTAANNTETYTYSVDFSDSDPVTGDQEWTITSIDAVNGVTSIPKSHGYPDPSPTTVYEGGYISAATLKLYPTSGNKLANFAKKLDQIRLVRKTLNSSDDKTDYTASNSNETIEGVKFTYDYSLQNGAENATTGKLTLKSIQKTGIDDQIALPASNLAYNNDLDGGSVTWSREKYDYWNGYSSYASDTDPERLHFNSFQKSIADRDAALWNLSEIESPLGAKTKIFYESDVISYVKDKQEKDVLLALGGPSEPTSITSSKIRVSWADSCRYDVFDGTSSGETRNFDIYTSGSSPTFIATIEVNKVYVNIIVQSPYVDFYTVEDPTSLGLLTDGTAYSFYEGDSRTAIYAGGHRINKVEVTDGLNSLTTFYTYSDGTTPVLPSAYRDLVTLSTDDHANDAYIIDKKYNNLGPSPSLGYSQVTVKEVKRESDGSYTPTKGRTIHKFYTAKDSIAQFAVLDTITDKLIITDKTGIIGKPKSVETYAMKDNTDGSSESDYYLIKKDDFYYDFSSDLISSNRKVYDGSFSTSLSSDKALGISHQNYQGTKDTDSTTVVNHIRENVFMTGTSSEFYFYDGSWNQTKYLTTGSNLAYDALTGKTLVTQTYRSEGKKTVNEIIPAYWNYDYYTQVGTSNYHVDNMLEKNMLMQESENRVYTLSSSDDWFSLTSTEKNNRITSASVTTWKPWIESHNYTGFVDSVYWEAFWRKNDTYEWISTGAFDDFSSSDWENYDLGDFHNSRKWKRTSNITKYDRYSHPVEEKGMDGTYTASIYGQGDALPIAIAKNAKRSQIIYIDFEEGQSTRNSSIYSGDQINYTAYFNNAKTGQYSQVTSSYPVTIPSESGTYTITYWRKEGSDPWELIRATGQTAGSTYTITGSSVRIDDIRVYPDQATMSTFTYDPLTWKLTSITDANNITTYYEYDTMGRLIKVLDHEQYLKQFHAYAYGRNH